MTTIASLNVVLGANSDGFTKGMGKGSNTLRGFMRTASAAGGPIGGLAGDLALMASPISAVALGLTAATGAMMAAGTAAGALAVKSVSLAAAFEDESVSMGVMMGSAQKAAEMLAKLTEFAAVTPFETMELSKATKTLVAFNIAQDDILPTLKSLGDISSGTGASINELSLIYGKAATSGRLFARDINQLSVRGIPIIAELAKQFGVADTEVRGLVRSGQVGFGHLRNALVSLTMEGGKFHNLMQERSQTLNGLLSTFRDNIHISMREFGTVLMKEFDLHGVTKSLIDITHIIRTEWVPVMASVARATREIFVTFDGLSRALTGADFASTFRPLIHSEMLVLTHLMAITEKFGQWLDMLAVLPDALGGGKFAEAAAKMHKITGDLAADAAAASLRMALDNKAAMLPADLTAVNTLSLSPTAAALAEDLDKLTAKLEEQIGVFGMLDAQAEIHKLKLEGLSDAELTYVSSLASSLSAMKAQQKAADELMKASNSLISGLQLEVDTWGMSSRQVDILKLSQMGAADATLDMASALDAQLTSLEATKKAIEENVRAREKLAESAAQIFADTRTPLEKLQTDLLDLAKLFDAGLISVDTFSRAIAQKEAAISGTPAAPSGPQRPAALERGTAAAFSKSFGADPVAAMTKAAQDTAKNTADMKKTLEGAKELLKVMSENEGVDIAP